MTRPLRPVALGALLVSAALSACAPAPTEEILPPPALPVMQWDHRPESAEWTEATLQALQDEGIGLLSEVPGDISQWCPGYVEADLTTRAAFWTGLFSALARFESTWNPDAVGGGGRWFGLVQIAPATARNYGCDAQTGQALTDGSENLECAVRIASHQVQSRGTISQGMLDWGPFHSANRRAEMRDWVSRQSYCQGGRVALAEVNDEVADASN
jgi:hypothetical protein